MDFLNKLERKYGKYAIRNLPIIMIALYAAGYLIEMMAPQMLLWLTLEPYYILRGQVWRLVTWILIPPSSVSLFTGIMLLFYLSLGQTMERTWGTFRFNVYILSGILFTIIGAFLLYFVTKAGVGWYFSTYYINMSIFLAFALTYPDMQVLLMFVIPIKMKWMALVYLAEIIYSAIGGSWATWVAIIASLLNFIIFFLNSRDMNRFTPRQVHRRQEFRRNVKKAQPKSVTKHKCAICGRTEQDGDHLEFRFCSKCDGNYEYCQDHLFTHQHVKKS